MARSYKAVVGGDIQKTFGWSIPGSPYALASNDEGVEATYDLTQYATLPAGVTPVWRVVASPAGVTIDQSGLLTKADSVPPYALYTVIIALSQDFDGYAETQRAFTFTVVPENSAPVWTGAPATLTMTSGVPYNFGQYASDPDGDTLTFSLIGAPSNYSINPVTGAVTAVMPSTTGVTMHDTNFDVDPVNADTAPTGWSLSNTSGTGDTRSFQTISPRSGARSLRFTLTRNSSADWRNEYASLVDETFPFCTSASAPQPIEQWVGYSLKFVSPYPTDTTAPEVIGQWHNGNTQEGTWAGSITRWDASPVVAIYAHTNGYLRLFTKFCDLIPANTARPATGGDYYGAGYEARTLVGLISEYEGIWTDWVWRVVWDWRQRGAALNPLFQYPSNWKDLSNNGGTGLVQIWTRKAGESGYTQRVDYVGPVGTNDYQASPLLRGSIPYFKFGIYKRTWETTATNVSTRSLEWDNVKIIRSGGSFEAVAPIGNP